jgi:membrane peptidoglycan carboxypeptidase
VLSPEEAWLMVDMMKDVVRRGTAAASVGAVFPLPSGGKTGTTNDYTDVWYIGYTSDLVAGVWMGFDKPERIMSNAQGGRLAAPAWTAFMTEVYRRKPPSPDWPRPAGIITKTVDLLTNTQWIPGCPGVEATEVFIAGTEPTVPCGITSGLFPDTSGFSTLPPGSLPPQPVDSMLSRIPQTPMPGRIVPGAVPMPRATQPRDTAGMGLPRSPAQPSPSTTFPRDTGRVHIDSIRRGGVTTYRRDTTRRDTTRRDTTRRTLPP